MREIFQKFFNEYLIASKNKWSGSEPFVQYVAKEVPEILYQKNIIDINRFLIKGSTGLGVYTKLPWIAIFNKDITTSAQRGIYIVYLFNITCNKVYLTLNQGCTDLKDKQKLSKSAIYKYLETQSQELSYNLNSHSFTIGNNISLDAESSNFNANCYQKGTIFYKQYTKQNLPSEEQLQQDLKDMLEIYEEYYEKVFSQQSPKITKEEHMSYEGGKQMSETKQQIEQIKEYITNKGFTYDGNLIENFYLSLKSKPFVILAGTSGTGKTRLAKLFAEGIGATEKNGQFKLVPVRPDWSDSSDLFGHVNLGDKFVPGAIIDFIKTASLPENKDKPYFLCLDEMNLARVEYYMSDFLSVIETRDFNSDKSVIETSSLITLDKYGKDTESQNKYGELGLPDNLYIIGTVNMDETTFPFSKKVLDRANTIEFSIVDLIPKFALSTTSVTPIAVTNSFLKSKYLKINECSAESEFVEKWCQNLVTINNALEKASLHVGYRVRDEIIFYMLNNKDAGLLLSENDAFDNEIMQKILPRIQGSSQSIKDLLCELFKICAGDFSRIQTVNNSASEQMQSKLESGDSITYKNSAKKIQFMTRRFDEDGFTSFWL